MMRSRHGDSVSVRVPKMPGSAARKRSRLLATASRDRAGRRGSRWQPPCARRPGVSAPGAAIVVALKAAERFSRVDAITLAALYDIRDPVGPMTAGDADKLISRALVREAGQWKWLDG